MCDSCPHHVLGPVSHVLGFIKVWFAGLDRHELDQTWVSVQLHISATPLRVIMNSLLDRIQRRPVRTPCWRRKRIVFIQMLEPPPQDDDADFRWLPHKQ
ncbi:hypothetical protein AgCh_035839 [Apium graveolens]